MKNQNEDNAEFTITQHFNQVFLKYFIMKAPEQQCPEYTIVAKIALKIK